MAPNLLKCHAEKAVACLTMNRPAQHNSLSPDLISEMSATLHALARDESVNSIVITGCGKTFCAGLDLTHLASLSSGARVSYMRRAFALFEQIHEMPQPMIAAVNGAAVAGGFDIAAFCDLRICTQYAKFGQPEVMLGATQFIYPSWTLVGLGRAKELALTGETISAEEAHRIGLVNHLVEADELMPRAMALAHTIASRPRTAVLQTKAASRDVPGLDRASAFERMGEALDRSLGSAEHVKALEQYLANLSSKG